MTKELATQRVQVTFIGPPPVREGDPAPDVLVEVDAVAIRE